MYHEFSILTIDQDLKNKQIIVNANQDILETESLTIELQERKTKTAVSFFYEIIDEKLIITFRDYPNVNSEYLLFVKNLKSVTEETLSSSIKKKIVFQSSVTSNAKIINPVNFEKLEKLSIKVKEEKVINGDVDNEKDNKKVSRNKAINDKNLKFYIEISTDNAFINLIANTSFEKEEIELNLKANGQYYLRARMQSEGDDFEYGSWCETVTFIYSNHECTQDNIVPDDDTNVEIPDMDQSLDPVVDLDELELISGPEQGLSCKSFIFEFNKDLSDIEISDMFVIRKEVK